MSEKAKKINFKGIGIVASAVVAVFLIGTMIYNLAFNGGVTVKEKYISSNTLTVNVITDVENKDVVEIPRGTFVKMVGTKTIDDVEYAKIKIEQGEETITGYILESNLVEEIGNVAIEEEVFVRTPTHIYKDTQSGDLLNLVDKGTKLDVESCELDTDGSCKWYKVSDGSNEGYVRGKYMVFTEEDSLLNYDPNGYFTEKDLTYLDYYPREKGDFEDKGNPENINAFYLTAADVDRIDEYLKIAEGTNINAFVIDIKESSHVSYVSPVVEKYSPSMYKTSSRTMEKFASIIKKIQDAGFYTIGRIVVFKDTYYAYDHQDSAIIDNNTGKPFVRGKEIFISAYDRNIWEYNVDLAKEAVKEFGFDEIQFDYIRFIDRTQSLDAAGQLEYHNKYNEEKAQAIQRFAMYAVDELHDLNTYVSGDVFGETAMTTRATAYGQQWEALSNIFDVISPMPYPDHFDVGNFGVQYPWTDPYKLMYNYHSAVNAFQERTPSPAIVRSWIQVYETWKKPAIKYDAKAVEGQIQGIFDAGHSGFMTWHTAMNPNKYSNDIDAYLKEYKKEEYKEVFNYGQ